MARKFFILAIASYLLWLLLSGFYAHPLLLSLGLVSAIGVALLSLFLRIVDPEENIMAFSCRVFLYLPWLLKEVVLSNLDVSKRIWQPTMRIKPSVVFVEANQKSDIGLVLHANSITLTPGTLSIDTGGGFIEVHALADDIADQVLKGEFDRRICALEGQA